MLVDGFLFLIRSERAEREASKRQSLRSEATSGVIGRTHRRKVMKDSIAAVPGALIDDKRPKQQSLEKAVIVDSSKSGVRKRQSRATDSTGYESENAEEEEIERVGVAFSFKKLL